MLLNILIALIFFSCASSPKYRGSILTDSPNHEHLDISEEDFNSHVAKGFENWKLRHKKGNLESFIKHFEFCARSSKQYSSYLINRYKMYEMLARGYYLLGNNHTNIESQQKQFWEEGAAWAERALYTNANFKRAVGQYGEFVPALKFIKKKEVGALYWYIANIGKWAKSSGIATSLKYLRLLKEMVRKIQHYNPKYFYSAADRYWGAYYSFIPFFAGGNMKKSRYHFERSLKVSPEYLGTKVLYAELYALKQRDSKLFNKLLNDVIDAKLNPKSDIYPENILEQQRAFKLKKTIEEGGSF